MLRRRCCRRPAGALLPPCSLRNVGVFWMRLAMYIMLCLGVGFVYFQLGDGWKVGMAVCFCYNKMLRCATGADLATHACPTPVPRAAQDVYSRAALLFFVVAFLTFMSIAAFPAFIEGTRPAAPPTPQWLLRQVRACLQPQLLHLPPAVDMKVFIRERLNGYYGVSQFTVRRGRGAGAGVFCRAAC